PWATDLVRRGDQVMIIRRDAAPDLAGQDRLGNVRGQLQLRRQDPASLAVRVDGEGTAAPSSRTTRSSRKVITPGSPAPTPRATPAGGDVRLLGAGAGGRRPRCVRRRIRLGWVARKHPP